MNTDLTVQSKHSLILPNEDNKREALLMKLDKLKTNSLSAKDEEEYKKLAEVSTRVFILICWTKIGVSLEQLKRLEKEDLKELASLIYEHSRILKTSRTRKKVFLMF